MDLQYLEALDGATIQLNADGSATLTTGEAAWSYALFLPVATTVRDSGPFIVLIDLTVEKGKIGIFPTDDSAETIIGHEFFVIPEQGRRCLQVRCESPHVTRVCLRNADDGRALGTIHSVATWRQAQFDITDVAPLVLRDMMLFPGDLAREKIAGALSQAGNRDVSIYELGRLELKRSVEIDLSEIFDDELGKTLVSEYEHFISLLPTYDVQTGWQVFGVDADQNYLKHYFRQSIIRVYHLVRMLRDFGVREGRLLEVGSLFGTFAGPLQRLGYDVTCIDRYLQFAGALDGYIADLRSSGITVIETSADEREEAEAFNKIDRYDIVISMAVIEHIPHTPRIFLNTLASHVAHDGLLMLDTPNIARYWNRRRLEEGLSIHQSIEYQFYSAIPFEGHHREYTADEMSWMLKQVGCEDIRLVRFDYNLFQFEMLTADHAAALCAMTLDPSLTDTVLVGGRVRQARSSAGLSLKRM
jgi:2-polyprenyl-3-methyl-5-hydroxy-6-metoxy-1,4-benzoquinol methylase